MFLTRAHGTRVLPPRFTSPCQWVGKVEVKQVLARFAQRIHLHDVLNLWKPPLDESIFFEPLRYCRLFFLRCWHAEWKQQQQDHGS